MTEAPFFVVGASRSGTTMLRLLLNAHSRLLVPLELKYFTTLPLPPNDQNWRAPDVTEGQFRSIVEGFFQARADMFDGIDLPALVESIMSSSDRDYRTPYVAAMDALMRRDSKVRWGEKTPKNLFFADILIEMFPEARFIYLVRDPRAAVNSMNAIKYYSTDSTMNACNWRQSATVGYDLLRRSVPESQRMVVRYEDLVADPESTLRTLCRFLGEEFEPEMLMFYKSTEHNMQKTIRSPLLKAPISGKNADKWRTELTPDQVAIVESVCGDAMRFFGYELEGGRPGPLAMLSTKMRIAYWNWKRRQRSDVRALEISFDVLSRFRSSN